MNSYGYVSQRHATSFLLHVSYVVPSPGEQGNLQMTVSIRTKRAHLQMREGRYQGHSTPVGGERLQKSTSPWRRKGQSPQRGIPGESGTDGLSDESNTWKIVQISTIDLIDLFLTDKSELSGKNCHRYMEN